jgi:Tol biopolymer transport system component
MRADGDGRHAVELAADASSPVMMPDDKHVVYSSLQGGVQSPWMTSLQGETPVPLVQGFAFGTTISPDGRSMAFFTQGERRLIATCDLPGCKSRQIVPVPLGASALQWTPDGKSLAYATGSNIWVLSFDGRAPLRLTRFDEDDQSIGDFQWSADGKRIAISRRTTTWDVVLFRGLKPAIR